MATSINKVFQLAKTTFGSGSIKFQWQKKVGTYLAAAGSNYNLVILERSGVVLDTIPLPGACTSLEWSPDGDMLVVACEKATVLFIWDATTKKLSSQLETNMKNIEILKWNLKGDKLAVGTSKGNLLLFDRNSGKKIPVLGKHSKAIVGMAWNDKDELACASEDNSFTLSSAEGDTIMQQILKGDPSQIQWTMLPSATDKHVFGLHLSFILSHKSLYLHSASHPEVPTQLSFQQKYGSIFRYQWYGDGCVLVAFQSGYILAVSTAVDQIGRELFTSRNHRDYLSDLVVSENAGKCATCGDNAIKIHDLSDLKEVYGLITLEEERGQLEKMEWSPEGKMLTVSTKSGGLYTYLTSYPTLSSTSLAHTAFLSNPTEVTVTNQADPENKPLKFDVALEPSVLCIGGNGNVIGVGSGAAIEFWHKTGSEVKKGSKREYMGTISSVSMTNDLAAVLLADGRLQIHSLPEQADSTATTTKAKKAMQKMVPEKEDTVRWGAQTSIKCVATSENFVVVGTASGYVSMFSADDLGMVKELKHSIGIKTISLQYKGVKCLFVDDEGVSWAWDPVCEGSPERLGKGVKNEGGIWDIGNIVGDAKKTAARTLFMTYDDSTITAFEYHSFAVKGGKIQRLGKTRRPFGLKPLVLAGDTLTCQTQSGKLSLLKLDTHNKLNNVENMNDSEVLEGLQTMYSVGQVSEIWDLHDKVSKKSIWETLSETAMNFLDLSFAKKIYRNVLKDAAMVSTIERIESLDDKNLLGGHVALIFGEFNLAQEYFLESGTPTAALDMRRDLLHWEQALILAQTLSPREVTVIAKEYASQLEFNGKYSDALGMYEKALASSDIFPGMEKQQEEHQISSSAGMTRMTFRLGDLSRGMKMLTGVHDSGLLGDCAAILEGIKQYGESGLLYERAQMWEKAADVHIRAKNFNKVAEILPHVTMPKIFGQYAKAREAEGKYEEAAKAYEKAKDFDSVVRIYVTHTRNIESAVQIVRRTKSRESAKLISHFFQEMRDFKSTVEFCLLAGLKTEAFEIAQVQDVMEVYAELVKDDATPDILRNIAVYFENKRMFVQAGRYMLQYQNYHKALELFLLGSAADPTGIELAIETVGYAKDDGLTHVLIDFLMGETDNEPKEAKYIFQLYMSLGQFREAAKTAIIIAREEQNSGNYRVAHDLLLDNMKQLQRTKTRIPDEMERMLGLLHSYILVKVLVRMEEHELAARMLVRVSSHISKFPAHIVPILTSTVIECYKSALKPLAFSYAATLMRPEYRSKVDEKYYKKIEQIVRRPEKRKDGEEGGGDGEEGCSPCPGCGNAVAESCLDCGECKILIPYCIATGKHITPSVETTSCPHCEFPANYRFFKLLLEKSGGTCPMCSGIVHSERLVVISDLGAWAKKRGKTMEGEEEAAATVGEIRKGLSRESLSRVGGLVQ